MQMPPPQLPTLEIKDVPRPDSDAKYVLVSRQAPSEEHEQAAAFLRANPECELWVQTVGRPREDELADWVPLEDLEFLEYYASVERVWFANGLKDFDISGLRHLTGMTHFTIAAHAGKTDDPAIVSALRNSPDLQWLSWGLRGKVPDILAGLNELKSLILMGVDGTVKDISALHDLPKIEDLALTAVSAPDLEPLLGLPSLKQVALIMGGTKGVSALGETSVEILKIVEVRGLVNLDFLSRMTHLEILELESLSKVTRLPDLNALTALANVKITSLKGLEDYSALATAPNLAELTLLRQEKLQPKHLEPLVGHPSLKKLKVRYEWLRTKRDEEIAAMFPGIAVATHTNDGHS